MPESSESTSSNPEFEEIWNRSPIEWESSILSGITTSILVMLKEHRTNYNFEGIHPVDYRRMVEQIYDHFETGLIELFKSNRMNLLQKDGEAWLLRYNGTSVTLNDDLGMLYLSYLLANPNHSFTAANLESYASLSPEQKTDISAKAFDNEMRDLEKQGENFRGSKKQPEEQKYVVSKNMLKEYIRIRDDLHEDLRCAMSEGRESEIDELEKSYEAARVAVSKSEASRGRARELSTEKLNQHNRVSKAIRRAIQDIVTEHPMGGEYLNQRNSRNEFKVLIIIDRGDIRYQPGNGTDWLVTWYSPKQ